LHPFVRKFCADILFFIQQNLSLDRKTSQYLQVGCSSWSEHIDL
jgi:hypothetical protein